MHHFFNLILGFLISFLVSFNVFAQLPNNYQNLSAEEKQDLLWSEITKSHEEDPLPQISGMSFSLILEKLNGLFNLGPTFDYVSDELPEGRVKIIHGNGSVCKISLIPAAGHPFTGIYQTGGIGLARLSLAIPPSNDTFIPGMAVKFLISNNPSVNLHIMNLLEGQSGNWNYFANDFSNQIPHATSWTLQAIEKIFEWTRDPANDLPLWHLAAWTKEGRYKGIPIYPEVIHFRPTNAVKNIIPESSRDDTRTSLLQIPFGPMYEVYGTYHDVEYHIGTLMLDSQILASNYGDKKLFFQHQR